MYIGGGVDIFIPGGLVRRAGAACIGGRGPLTSFVSVFAEKIIVLVSLTTNTSTTYTESYHTGSLLRLFA